MSNSYPERPRIEIKDLPMRLVEVEVDTPSDDQDEIIVFKTKCKQVYGTGEQPTKVNNQTDRGIEIVCRRRVSGVEDGGVFA